MGILEALSNSLSRVLVRSHEDFGNSQHFRNCPMTMIKGLILSESALNSSATFGGWIEDVNFFTEYPDVEITYNQTLLDEMYFSLDTVPGAKYDFVTVALRDLWRGFGFTHTYRYNPVTRGLDVPAQKMLPFEQVIEKSFGEVTDASDRLTKATQGELMLSTQSSLSLKLYAPQTWQNGVSLNSFIPDDNCSLSKLLSYNFGKGTVYRSLNDHCSGAIFWHYLGWSPNFTTGGSSASSSGAGNTSIKLPYNGSLTISYDQMYPSAQMLFDDNDVKPVRASQDTSTESAWDYVHKFHPFNTPDDNIKQEGVSISVLKKDGTWDLLYFIPVYIQGEPVEINMSELTFNCDAEEYARTADGYLRARVTTSSQNSSFGTFAYRSTYFVIDYLPQTVKLSVAIVNDTESQASLQPVADVNAVQRIPVRLYFQDIEGLNRILVERLRQGSRLPTRIEVPNIADGYLDTTIEENRTTTFTAVGYNDNGHTRSVPVVIDPRTTSTIRELSVDVSQNQLMINGLGDTEVYYEVRPLTEYSANSRLSGYTTDGIDISQLPAGLYIVKVINENEAVNETLKFKK